ncbi:hypothetical protein [Nonomuraea rubra]|uniref:hypothetical protein n=1 Tax=Nonomuraea rubra TaxID=46180 RepID=UPI00360F009A
MRAHVQRPPVQVRRHVAGQPREHAVDHLPGRLAARRLARGGPAPADLGGQRQGEGVAGGEARDGGAQAGLDAAGFEQRGRLRG